MKNPRLRGKIILSTFLFLLVMGALSSTVYSHFQEYLSVSYWNTTAVPLKLTEGNTLVDDLSRTSPAWRQKLSKHIFNQIDQELQSLGKQSRLQKNAEAKRLISKVQASLKKMKSGKQKFVSTGQEPSLSPFYRGRHTLEYSLWKLKGLTQDLNPGSAQSQKVYRVYALVNKWLVYVAHREINARRKGIPDSSPLTEAQVSPDPQAEETNTSFPQISEVAKITEQDMAKADKALSRQPAPLQETLPDSDPEPLKSPEAKTALVPEAPLIQEESPVSPKILESENTALSQPSATEQAATPGIDLDAEENENSFSSQPPLNGPESAPEAEL
ncbi:MAG: CHASE3 domain-containing protein, partial [Nitrospinota bacterium]|nr:CHASE3 domain-containing protein [Nitrospinota bacterium]